MYAFDKPMTMDMNALLELISSVSIDKNDARWKSSQSVYTSVKVDLEMEFGSAGTQSKPLEMLAALTGDSEGRKMFDDMKQRYYKE